MSQEKYIEGRKQGEHHFGRHSVRMRLDASMASLKAWSGEAELPRVRGLGEIFRYPVNLRADSQRRQRIAAHDRGKMIGNNPDGKLSPDQYPEGIGTEIELFFEKRDCEA